MTSPLETVELETGSPAAFAVIWLHGLGADGHDFEPVVPALRLHDRRVRFVFPHAPIRPVSLNAGMRMRAWYDIYGLEQSANQDVAGIRESEEQVRRLVEREVERGVPPERIVLAGFSQGGVIALHAGLRHPTTLGGIMGLSTYLPLAKNLEAELQAANRASPIFIAHGTADPMVPLALGEACRMSLESWGYRVTWRTYPMPHAVCPQEVLDIRTWLLEVFKP